MTGPEHYRAAEALLQGAMDQGPLGSAMSDRTREFAVAQARVHATLALAAATFVSSESGYTRDRAEAWAAVTA